MTSFSLNLNSKETIMFESIRITTKCNRLFLCLRLDIHQRSATSVYSLGFFKMRCQTNRRKRKTKKLLSSPCSQTHSLSRVLPYLCSIRQKQPTQRNPPVKKNPQTQRTKAAILNQRNRPLNRPSPVQTVGMTKRNTTTKWLLWSQHRRVGGVSFCNLKFVHFDVCVIKGDHSSFQTFLLCRSLCSTSWCACFQRIKSAGENINFWLSCVE